MEQFLSDSLRRLYLLPKRTPSPPKAGGRGAYEFSAGESDKLLQIVRLMKQVSLFFTLNALFIVVGAVKLALANGWEECFGVFNAIDDFSIAYFLLAASAAFEAIAETKDRDMDYMMAALDALSKLWSQIRIPCAAAAEAPAPRIGPLV